MTNEIKNEVTNEAVSKNEFDVQIEEERTRLEKYKADLDSGIKKWRTSEEIKYKRYRRNHKTAEFITASLLATLVFISKDVSKIEIAKIYAQED